MKIAFIIFSFMSVLFPKDIVLKPEGKYKITSDVHLVDGIQYKVDESYQALIEIPAGTTAKWEVNHKSGNLEWEFKKGVPREVKFLGYPGNYGFIPQTVLDKDQGGDGDPLDIIVLGSAVKRGSLQKVRILGAIKLLDKGEQDDKIIAIPLHGPFSTINSLGEMMEKVPGAIQIVHYWFTGYKGGKMHFMGYMERKKADELIEKAHISWSKHKNGY